MMFTIESVLITFVAAVVLAQSTSPTTMPTTAMNINITTDPEEMGSATDDYNITDTSKYTSVESTAAMTELEGTLGDNNATSSSPLSNRFVLSTTWKIVIIVGGFTVLTALPLVIIMILIVALGCMCIRYKRLKNRLSMPLDTIIAGSNCTTMEMTTMMNNNQYDEVPRNIVILDGIDTDTNVAYGRTSTMMSESQDIRKSIMITPNTEAAGERDYNRNTSSSSILMMSGGSAAHGRLSTVSVVEGTVAAGDEEEMALHNDTAEDDGDDDYVINDMYDSIT